MFPYIVLAVIGIWLLTITYLLLRTRGHYNKLVSRTRRHQIDGILDALLENEEKDRREIEDIKKRTEDIVKSALLHYQKIGLVRFNPFGRTEGEKSLVISFLDGQKNGMIINFIYTHEGLRIYSKRIKEGKGEEYNLSEEEMKAISEAK
jgi:hypothetical protein